MRDDSGNSAYKRSELLDVELLDVFAEIEAMLRGGREVQREALRVRGLPNPVSASQRLDAARSIRKHLAAMTEQCQALTEVLQDLDETAADLEKLLEGEGVSSPGTRTPLTGDAMAFGKGKKSNVTGTQPRKRADAPADTPGTRSAKSGPGRRTGPKHSASRAAGQRTTATRKAGPKKTRSRTTTRSADK